MQEVHLENISRFLEDHVRSKDVFIARAQWIFIAPEAGH